MADPTQLAKELHEDLGDDSDVSLDELEEAFENLINYDVPPSEAKNSLRRKYGDELSGGGSGGDGDSGGDPETNLGDIDTDEEWVTATVSVVELWEPRSDSVSQVGLVGDESGTMKFVAFESSNLDTELEEGKSYRLSPVVTDEFQGRFSIKLNRNTTIEELDEDVEVADNDMDVVIPIVDVQSGSGLIKRCPVEEDGDTCGRPTQNGRCTEHGEVDGEFDLRIKAVGDNGNTTVDILFDKERTTELTGINLDEAREQARDAMDRTVVSDDIADQIVGNYYHVTGSKPGEYLLVDECEKLEKDTEAEAREFLDGVGA